MPNKQILLDYARIKIEISKLEAELEMIKPSALSEVLAIRGEQDVPVQLQELPGYSFTVQKRKTWTYPLFIQEAQKSVKEKQKEAEATGEATFEEKEQLMFIAPKE